MNLWKNMELRENEGMIKERIFYSEKRDMMYYVVQNLCSCHPHDLLLEWGKKGAETAYISFDNEAQIEMYLSKWIEL